MIYSHLLIYHDTVRGRQAQNLQKAKQGTQLEKTAKIEITHLQSAEVIGFSGWAEALEGCLGGWD